ncbi:MAG: hypothetical protein NC112_02135 [Oxalobacter formigenes]|nr:hypothetical protein [Oxalobacter formigenes]
MNKKAGYVFLLAIAALCSGLSSAEEAKCMQDKKSATVLRNNGEAIKLTGKAKATGTWFSHNNQYQLHIGEKTFKVAQSKFKDCEYNPSALNLSSNDAIKIAADAGTVASIVGMKGMKGTKGAKGAKAHAASSAISVVPSLLK